MICTRRTTIKIRPELAQLDAVALDRLSPDELAKLVQMIEEETQLLNKMRRMVAHAISGRHELTGRAPAKLGA